MLEAIAPSLAPVVLAVVSSGTITAIVTLWFGRRRARHEAEGVDIANEIKLAEAWQAQVAALAERVAHLETRNATLFAERQKAVADLSRARDEWKAHERELTERIAGLADEVEALRKSR